MAQQLLTEQGCLTADSIDKVNDNFAELYAGGTVAPGADTQVVFNDGDVFGADAGFTYDKTTNALTVTGNVTASGSANVLVIPTADPHVAGAIWNDTGTLKVSAG